MKARIAVIAGDGIGPEVVAEGVRVLEEIEIRFAHEFTLHAAAFGGAAIDLHGDPLPPATLAELTSIALSLRERVGLPARTRYRLVGVGVSGFREREELEAQGNLFGS